MMKSYVQNVYKCLCVLLLSLFWMASEARSFDDSEVLHVSYPGWFNENTFNDLSEVINQSIDNGKKGLMVLFTTEGCSYCDQFIRRSLGDSEIASIVQSNFESVGLEIFDDVEMLTPAGEIKSIKQFAVDEKVQFSPTLLFYGEQGERILRMTGYLSPVKFRKVLDFVIHGHYSSTSFGNYLLTEKTAKSVVDKPEKINTALIPNPLFGKPPYILDRSRFPANGPLLVIFEESDCAECNSFHVNVLSQKEVLDSLMQFEVFRFDAKDDKTPLLAPDGSKITPAQWYKKSDFAQVPAMLFFDEHGNEVLKTDALVLTQRMMNSLNYVLEKAYTKNWSYQRFARSKAIERHQKKQQ